MPYDICEDEVTLDYIESEMAKRGITQEMIDQTRATTENIMLTELKRMIEAKEDLEIRDHQGATPVMIAIIHYMKYNTFSNLYFTVTHCFCKWLYFCR